MLNRDRQKISLNEVSAEIRNKLQAAMTALESLKASKAVPKDYIDKALKDLEKIEELI